MSGPDGVGNSGVDKTGGPDRSTSASGPDRTETDAIAADAVGAPDAAAQAEARTIADQQGLTVYQGPEEKSTLEAVGDWVADTGIGYAQGAANTVLGAAELVNGVTNAGLGAVGIDYRFSTDMQIQPKSAAQANAQNAIAVGEVLAGGYGLYKSAPRIAQTLDDAGNWIASRAKGRPRNTVFNGTSVGDLRGPVASRHRLESITEKSVAKRTTTVAEPGVDISKDVADIRAGLGKIDGERITVNGRTYGSHDGTLYPIEGQGLHQLDRGTFKALQTMRKHGVDGAQQYLDNMGVNAETRAAAEALYRLLP